MLVLKALLALGLCMLYWYGTYRALRWFYRKMDLKWYGD